MYSIKRLYNQNRRKIWVVGLAVVFMIILLKTLNNIGREQAKGKLIATENTDNQTITENTDNQIVTGTKTKSTVIQRDEDYINQFINFCNQGNISSAYNMLSDECKEELFPSEEEFEKRYHSEVFANNKSAEITQWRTGYNSSTYKIEIMDSILSTGNVNASNSFYDYYTVIMNKGDVRLNIGGYIMRESCSRKASLEDITFEIESKEIYKEYEKYNLKITNNSAKTIIIDTQENTQTTYLLDSNNSKYLSYIYELTANSLTIKAGEEKNYSIRFNKIYSNNIQMKSIVFSDVVLNYEEYKVGGEKEKVEVMINI